MGLLNWWPALPIGKRKSKPNSDEVEKVMFACASTEADAEQLYAELAGLVEDEPAVSGSFQRSWAENFSLERQPRGAKSVEHQEILRTSNPCYGSLAPSRDHPSKHEVSYDPRTRWNVLGKHLDEEPRGAKSLEHEEILRTSNPDYGSLLPSRDRPSKHEVSYDPRTRYNVLGKHLDEEPRGAKSLEHAEVLRASNPCYGSLAPSRDRPSKHEVSYDPMTRWNVLGKHLDKAPRGAKSLEHLRVLRTSDPSFNSLAPSIWRLLPLLDSLVGPEAEDGAHDGAQFSTLAALRALPTIDALRALRALRASGAANASDAVALPLEEGGWRLLQPAKKTFNFDSFDEYTDDESSESGDGVPEMPGSLSMRRQRHSRFSNTSDDSERSNARTMERVSNDSVSSLLEEDFPELASPKQPAKQQTIAEKLALLNQPSTNQGAKQLPAQQPNPLAGWRVR